ncbi:MULTISPECIES: murein L,D-transpeptidase family protein [unclassified Afipia]|uniref:L,D-transpeptidase family protein n=1 Tax=unclassified Afipia TaxID=2642050 RepID=UPI00041FAEFD|nr:MULTISPECIES: murein L,D-transpeptidase family protein [unclassified Afipia]
MIDRTHIRALVTSAALAAGVLLAGCNGEQLSPSSKANRPIPDKLLADIESKNMDKASPILVRLFKQEAELEVWKQDRNGKFALLKTYPICRWSGDLGPKVKEGDRQAPEGFYSITPAQMNPTSAYFLSFNMGYPNAYDKAWGRTGSQLMVHGDCSSRGCYAMTDEQISEIYALGRESFFGGQNAFQVQAYPFRMTPQNMARHRNNPNMPFWKMIKEGNDHFEVTKQEPKVDFCEKKYVFDAEKPAGSTRPLTFNASAQCPAYQVSPEIAEAVQDKQRQDELKTAQLISRGTATARSRAGIDGGMHPVFASKLPEGEAAIDRDVTDYAVASNGPAPGTVPAHATIPKAPEPAVPSFSFTSSNSEPMVAVTSTTPAASANASASSSEGFFSKLSRSVGLRGSDPQPPAAAPAKPTAVTAAPKAKSPGPTREAAKSAPPRVIPLERSQQAQAPAKPAAPAPATTAAAAAPAAPASQPSLAGAQPAVQANSFDSRWSTVR